MDKMNVLLIVKDHIKIFHKYGTNQVNLFEVAFFFGMPAVFGVIYVIFLPNLGSAVTDALISASSIICGLLLNLMVLLYSLIFNSKKSFGEELNITEFKNLCKEVLSSISFLIIVCLILIVSSFLCGTRFHLVNSFFTFLAVSAGIICLLSLLIVIKRCYIIVNYDIENSPAVVEKS